MTKFNRHNLRILVIILFISFLLASCGSIRPLVPLQLAATIVIVNIATSGNLSEIDSLDTDSLGIQEIEEEQTDEI